MRTKESRFRLIRCLPKVLIYWIWLWDLEKVPFCFISLSSSQLYMKISVVYYDLNEITWCFQQYIKCSFYLTAIVFHIDNLQRVLCTEHVLIVFYLKTLCNCTLHMVPNIWKVSSFHGARFPLCLVQGYKYRHIYLVIHLLHVQRRIGSAFSCP